MSDYDDLFKDFDEVKTEPSPVKPPFDDQKAAITDPNEPKRNKQMLLIYIILTLLVSIGSTILIYIKYSGVTTVVNNLLITEEIAVAAAPSGDTELPYEIQMTGAIKNDNWMELPIVYVEYTFYDEQNEVLGTHRIDSTDLAPGATFAFDETILVDYEFSTTEYAYGFDESSFFYLATSLIQVALIGIIFIIIDKHAFKRDGQKVIKAPGRVLIQVLIGFALLWATMILSQLFMEYVIRAEPVSENESTIAGMFVNDPLQLLMLFFLLCVFTPIVEEIVFRKVVCTYFDAKFGRVWAIALSGVVFGLMHVIAYGDFVQSIPYIAMGAVFGYIYFRVDRNIYVTIGVHFLNNFVSYLLYLLPLLGYSLL